MKFLSLKSSKEIEKTLNKGEKINTKNIFSSFIDSEDLFIAFAPSKKNWNAVKRNKIKRQLRWIILNLEMEKPKAKIVFVPKKDYFKTEFINISNDLEYIIKKINEKFDK